MAALAVDLGRQVEENSTEIQQLRGTSQRLMSLVQVLASQNEALQREIQHERELRESHMRELELRLRLQIAEELRRLPPPSE